jgi:hypothetical protein
MARKTEEATLPDAGSPSIAATELDLVTPVLLIAGSAQCSR